MRARVGQGWTLLALRVRILHEEGEVKAPITIALALAILLSGSLAAYAQTEQPSAHRHYYGRITPPSPCGAQPAPERRPHRSAAAAKRLRMDLSQARCSSHTLIPDEGDSDGLSRDPDDCMKGCIGGNPQ